MSEIVRVQEILSKLWNLKIASKNCLNLITIISTVAYDPSFETNGSFKDFVSRLLARRNIYRIRKFSLKLRSMEFDSAKYNLVNDCVRNVLHRGVLDLELDIDVNEDYTLPFELFYIFREAVPVFENLFHLSLTTEAAFCWDVLPILLEKSPNLETLTIEARRDEKKLQIMLDLLMLERASSECKVQVKFPVCFASA
ncbi:unnamed protein product [Arabidopsis arenosa]|uniref:FBD domain-containing protein n=1 Tax=Arabidopsis arenosa TaxID=38785 RepID=A0A8S2ABL8_ARAAE|nr:unnamed protein product [Arabidopsis arenosa]